MVRLFTFEPMSTYDVTKWSTANLKVSIGGASLHTLHKRESRLVSVDISCPICLRLPIYVSRPVPSSMICLHFISSNVAQLATVGITLFKCPLSSYHNRVESGSPPWRSSSWVISWRLWSSPCLLQVDKYILIEQIS